MLTIWLDVDTRLPVRIEFATSSPQESDESRRGTLNLADKIRPDTVVLVTDHFNWHPDLPADTFTLKVPDDFRLIEHQ